MQNWKTIIVLVVILFTIGSFSFGAVGILEGFFHPIITREAISSFNLSVFITAFIIGLFAQLGRSRRSRLTQFTALMLLILSVVLWSAFSVYGLPCDIHPLALYSIIFISQAITAGFAGYLI